MTITSYATYTAGLAALSVTGVTKKFTEPPGSIGTADLPAMWPGLPRGEEPAMTFQTSGGWPTLTCELIIAVEAVNQGTQAQNYALVVSILDNLSTALRTANLGRYLLTWTVNANATVEVSGTSYWAIVCTIAGR